MDLLVSNHMALIVFFVILWSALKNSRGKEENENLRRLSKPPQFFVRILIDSHEVSEDEGSMPEVFRLLLPLEQ